MLIQQKEIGHKGKFFIQPNGQELAEMIYALPTPGTMIIEHTEVDDALRGQNVGYMLVSKAAEYAREKHLKIIPQCPFAKAIMARKHEEFKDVLKA